LLAANLLSYYGENERLRLAGIADLEKREASYGRVAMAVGAYSVLEKVQRNLENYPVKCTAWREYTESFDQVNNYSGMIDRFHYKMNIRSEYTEHGSAADNFTLISPFNGYVSGHFNLKLSMYFMEAAGPRLPSYSRTEVHYVHIPVSFERSIAICLSALNELRAELGSLEPCTLSEIPSLMEALELKYKNLSGINGLKFEITTSLNISGECYRLDYKIMITEDSEGVSGKFAWSVFEEGSLLL
jgi:hypothetical protein